jgi:signal transduction histidine kinase
MCTMTGLTLDQGRSAGRSSARADDELRIRGLLHDLGHQMMTLSLLTETVDGDTVPDGEARERMQLVLQEMFRAMDLMTDVLPGEDERGNAEPVVVDLHDLAAEVAQFAGLAYGTSVRVVAGAPAGLRPGQPRSLWRVLTNLVDNAVRAAGPDGQVEISIGLAGPEAADGLVLAAVDVADNGPGFGNGPHGTSGLGMSVVRQLLAEADGRLEIAGRPGGGTRVRVVIPVSRNRGEASA